MIIEKLQPQYVQQAVVLQQQIVPCTIDPEYAAAHYETMFLREDCCVFTAREGDELLGTVSGFCCPALGGNYLVIEDLIVSEKLRGGGIGTSLMSAVEEFGRQTRCDYAIFVSSGFRKRAHHFYRKIGYTEDVRGFRKDL